jgi:hypothetical protein
MGNKILHNMPPELDPTRLEKIALLSKMYKFSFTLGICIVALPFSHLFMPNGGILGFILRVSFAWVSVILAQDYLDKVAKSYFERVGKHMMSISDNLLSEFEKQQEEESVKKDED